MRRAVGQPHVDHRRQQPGDPERAQRLARPAPASARRLSGRRAGRRPRWPAADPANALNSPPSCAAITHGGTCPSSRATTAASPASAASCEAFDVVGGAEHDAAEVAAGAAARTPGWWRPGPRSPAGTAAPPCARATAGAPGAAASRGPRPGCAAPSRAPPAAGGTIRVRNEVRRSARSAGRCLGHRGLVGILHRPLSTAPRPPPPPGRASTSADRAMTARQIARISHPLAQGARTLVAPSGAYGRVL